MFVLNVLHVFNIFAAKRLLFKKHHEIILILYLLMGLGHAEDLLEPQWPWDGCTHVPMPSAHESNLT